MSAQAISFARHAFNREKPHVRIAFHISITSNLHYSRLLLIGSPF
jgi:hypothetical protein